MEKPRILGPCSREISWMLEEGFFDDKSRISENWLFNASDDTLRRVIDMMEVMSEETWSDPDDDDDTQDAFYAIIALEGLKTGKETLECCDEDLMEWVSLYGISAVLESQRRQGLIKLESRDVPLVEPPPP